jgi:hypothetical protein
MGLPPARPLPDLMRFDIRFGLMLSYPLLRGHVRLMMATAELRPGDDLI